MSFLTNLWADLVEKRLWPVAAVLLVAVIGVPIALGSGATPVAAPIVLGVTGTTGPAPGEVLVTLDAGAALRADRLGRVHDPFDQPGVQADKAPGAAQPGGVAGIPGTTTPTPAPSGGGSPAGTPVPSAGGGGGTPAAPANPAAPSGTPPPTAPANPAAPKDTPPVDPYLATLRIGRAGSTTPKAKDVKRLTPLPSAENPFLVYLGVLTNKRTAVFMLSADVKATGDGTCRPRPSSCETLELHKGETEHLAVTREDGTVDIYRLELVRIVRAADAGTPEATAARHRRQRAVTTVTERVHGDADGSDAYAYDATTGLLQRLGSSAGFGGHLPGADDTAVLRGGTAEQPPPDGGLAAFPVYSPGL